MKSIFSSTIAAVFTAIVIGAHGCGYSLQTSQSPLVTQEGIKKIYIAPIKNNSYKVGVENTVFNALTKSIGMRRAVEIVKTEESADATLSGNVTNASYGINTTTIAKELQPRGLGPDTVQVATLYLATLTCDFKLTRSKNASKKAGLELWSAGFTREKIFSANNQLDTLGKTSALINDSEFERALQVMSENMTREVQEAVLSMF